MPAISPGLDKIENLQNSTSQEVYQKAFDVIDTYFGAEEEGDGAAEPGLDPAGEEFRMTAPAADQPIQF